MHLHPKRLFPLLAGLALIVLPVVLLPNLPTARAADDELRPTEQPMLWRIEHPDSSKASYLFGTIHIGHPAVLTLHPEVEKAHAEADAVYCELKMDAHSKMKMALELADDTGKTLAERLPEDLYAQLREFMAARGVGVTNLDGMRLWAVEMQASLLDEVELMSGAALDERLYEVARRAKKEVGGIETLAEQFAVFESMSTEEQIESLRDTLTEADKAKAEGRKPLRELVEVYLEGDVEKLMAKMNEDYDPEDEDDVQMMKRLLDDRNVRMADRSGAKILEKPQRSFFFAYGAAHMPGPKGVVELLRQQGFTVTRVAPATARRDLEPLPAR